MKTGSHRLLEFGATVNDLDDRLPKSRGDCFDVGIWGGCGINCPVFLRGDCNEPQELIEESVEEMPQDDIDELADYYDCFEPLKGYGSYFVNGVNDESIDSALYLAMDRVLDSIKFAKTIRTEINKIEE